MTLLRSLVLFIIALGFCTEAVAQQTVTAQEDSLTPTAGVIRPIDFIEQNPRWNTATTNQFTHFKSSGLYGFYGPQPVVLLDGIPVDNDFFGWQNLDMLPLLVDKVSKVNARFTSGVYRGTHAGAGLVDFKAEALDTGFTAYSSYYAGNETGDPGPFVFDSLKTTPNIDRWGPDGSVYAAYKRNGWYAKGSFVFRNNKPSRLILNQRIQITSSLLGTNQVFVNYNDKITNRSGLLETGYAGQNWSVKSRGLFGRANDYLFLQPFGREVPTQTQYRQFAIEGTYEPDGWVLNGRYTTHNKTIRKRFDLHTFIFDWDQTDHTLSASAKYQSSAFNIEPGIVYKRINTRAPGIRQPFNDLATFFINSRIALGTDAALKVDANLDYDEERWAQTIESELPLNITKSWKIIPGAFYSELLPLRQNSFAYWTGRGYTFADTLDITINQPLDSFFNKSTGISLANRFSLSNNISLLLEQRYLRHNALNIPWQVVRENEFVDTLPGRFTATREEGRRLSVLAQIEHTLSGLLRQQFTLHLQRTQSGTDRYREYFEQIPNTKITYQFDINPTPNLILSLQTTYRSASRWAEFSAIDGVEYGLPSGIPIRRVTGTFDTDTPSFTKVDLSVRKWFWNRHISAQFTVNNLLNDEVRTHTLGSELTTKFDFKVALNF